ncbi:uncharacterized protein LOC114762973 [Neltuma alba]|uniref:uncharacterized protein LOC114762973 n=1 Tax=Neltuma alba TaxID=207710 RepID=UPI0010A5314C|nr:uncharacterized protein LOC114762973 [Prosopis alba]
MNRTSFIWNCQGAASRRFHTVLKSLLHGFKPDLIALLEPRISGVKADRVIKKLNYPNLHRVEAEGFSGGIWLMWSDQIKVHVLLNHKQFIHTHICSTNGESPYLFTTVYGNPKPTMRETLWEDLHYLCINEREAWLLAGNFNATLTRDERRGGARSSRSGNRAFKDFVHTTGLIDLGFTGPEFTWKRGSLLVRLDRALTNQTWIASQPNAIVMHLPRIQSDHRPLLIKPEGEPRKKEPIFRFLAPWIAHPDFKNLLAKNWSNEESLARNIEKFIQAAHLWNRDTFGSIGKNKRILR